VEAASLWRNALRKFNFCVEASKQCAGYGLVLEEGHVHLGLARCLITLGDREAATETLQKARSIFSRLGAIPLLQEMDDYMRQVEAAS
jgi:hypothetical protein